MKKLVQLRDHYLVVWQRLHIVAKYFSKYDIKGHHARKYLQLPYSNGVPAMFTF